ncbi:MAG TPA: bifunctional hydroxymethylpyrimidine kinase/phosphomethylpyrimidine kinase [Candidatus Methanoculleus thermohydrogenotrophicum]|jgi:hydroxymethylpyrimidine/phosphomethylpyrimidine kinase|nr:bifunctional hydroxymethylpyrimidine kinase/phosphomethylpyrimidine kinase [Candidatus Methanoculleus thermohydrogenotrophicum]HOB18347.1 bifunctional hydroxymethylpyrimidine kinase/phosphomethylpyrimidine kinase [Candidatus Methanoculleus thermohydrogenotrophicum]HPZ37834.1 bifunctional hydroxymethylpyrimidine kinase/phosphomethylpyrimidine kinase [Candidatus Methanoculleus thermohydrogenotrophicum]HQC91060.1 bifunctional hydroxymethylpyrimidine kinase/phosphomethylpyrimidine kinase [Candida
MTGAQIVSACSIAGSDSGGGAGIQADIKTFTALEVFGLTVITAVTAQNTREVRGTWMLPLEAVRAQIEAVVDEFVIGAWKTGMLGNAANVRAVAEALPLEAPLVIDPVMVSTSGHRLLDADAVADLVDHLIPRAEIVTPNLPEAGVLAGMRVVDLDDMTEAGRRILDLGARAVVVKGGHLAGDRAVDILVDRDGVMEVSGRRYPYSVHGSGCCFSAALAAYLARGMTTREAFFAAREFIDTAIGRAVGGPGALRIVNPGGGHIRGR